jgi:hypothetical protein
MNSIVPPIFAFFKKKRLTFPVESGIFFIERHYEPMERMPGSGSYTQLIGYLQENRAFFVDKPMFRRKKDDEEEAFSLRPTISLLGICDLMGVCRDTLDKRKAGGLLDGITCERRKGGYQFDMEEVFQRIFPSADGNTIAQLMYDFMRNHDGRRSK